MPRGGGVGGGGTQHAGGRRVRAIAAISWQQALAWRLRRHFLDRPADVAVEAVAERLCGVQSQVASSAELAIRLRMRRSGPRDVSAALEAVHA